MSKAVNAYATQEIIDEYRETVAEMIRRKQGHISLQVLSPLIGSLGLVKDVPVIQVCRDSDDDKFIACAKVADALYIVSGDKDLLSIGTYEGIEILTAREFCSRTGLA